MKINMISVFLILSLAVLVVIPKVTSAAVIVKIGSNVTVEEERSVDNVIVIGGQITVHGRVEQNAVAVGGSVVLGHTAVVGGDVIAVGGIIVRGRGAEVGGNLTEINASELTHSMESLFRSDWEGWHWIYTALSIVMFIGFSILALLITALFPNFIHNISGVIQQNTLRVVLSGLLGLIMIVPLAVLLTVSVVGIVLIPLEIILVICAVLVGVTSVSQLVGRRMFALIKKSQRGMIGETLLGLLILWIIGWLPYIGLIIKVCVVILALGGVLVGLFSTRKIGAIETP